MVSAIRQSVLDALKHHGPSSIAELAARLPVSYEAIRLQMATMGQDGFVQRQRLPATGAGRPTSVYALTQAGEHLFPKHYDLLANELIETLASQYGIALIKETLAALVETRMARWTPQLAGKTLPERVRALQGIYLKEDPFMEVEEDADGLRLIEHNCPFLNVAQHHPALCSVTINTLSRLLGVRVVREERFQNGDGRCAFRILADQPLASRPGPRDGKRGAVEFFSRLSFLTDRPPLDILPVPCIQ